MKSIEGTHMDYEKRQVWFLTGSQSMYGPETLKQVEANAREVAKTICEAASVPVEVAFKQVIKTPGEATTICQQANNSVECVGVITWCHTFSPSKMWINGLKQLKKPLLHLHTQHHREIPWSSIDMDFMNLNQAAHGDREHGFIMSRLRLNRKVVAGHWQDKGVHERIGAWARAAVAWHDWQGAKFCRFGDNMREVAVTEGDKVAAQMQFGYSVDGYGIGDLSDRISRVQEREIDDLIADYEAAYAMDAKLRRKGPRHQELREAARIEAGMRAFLKEGNFRGFTTCFEDLHGVVQLPGLAVQRLMAEGYGFGAEGDWKTCALVRAMKVMAAGLKGGTSFMEDYTYHMGAGPMQVLGAHMLEICPTIAQGKSVVALHKLGIGGKADPARLVFEAPAGEALNASLIDLGNRFRLIVNEVKVVRAPKPLPKLPVARAVWIPKPDLQVASTAWIYAGGAHHTGFSQVVTTEMLEDFAEMCGVEFLVIDDQTRIRQLKEQLRWNEVYYGLNRGFVS